MKSMFNKSIITYVIGIFILVAAVGGIISLVVTNYIALISTLLIMYIVLILIMLQIFHKYIKPIEKTSRIVTELVEGNFRARIHHPANGRDRKRRVGKERRVRGPREQTNKRQK